MRPRLPKSVEFDRRPKRIDKREGDWPYKQAVGGLLWISGMTRPDIANAVRAVTRHAQNSAARQRKVEGGSEDNCLPQGKKIFGGCVPAGRGLGAVVVR